jgi:hypothetical protein
MNATEKYLAYIKQLRLKYNRTCPLDITYSADTCAAGYDDTTGVDMLRVAPARLELEIVKGFTEYDSVIHVWPMYGDSYKYFTNNGTRYYSASQNMKGDMAIWAVALHEFAHLLQNGTFDISYQIRRIKGVERQVEVRDVHGEQFQNILAKLIRENPYKDMFWSTPKESWEIFLGL